MQTSNNVNDIMAFDFEKELETIIGNITWFATILQNYSYNISPKLEVANKISASLMTTLSEKLESIENRLELLAFEPMRNEIRTVKKKLRNW